MAPVVSPPVDPQLVVRPVPRSRPRTAVPLLSVVVVNYRQWTRTNRLVRQLGASHGLRQGQAEVVVIDNHSPVHPLISKLRRAPGVSLRRWRQNYGFARAVNEGCRLSRGEWFLLLNPDMTLADGFVDEVLALAERVTRDDPRAGIIGFHLRNSDGSRQLSAGSFPTLASTLLRLLLPRSRRKYRKVRTSVRCRVPWVSGCCLLVKRQCLEQLGGLDESYFLYYEDLDLCRRAQQAGWSVWHEPNVAAVHHRPLHGRPVPAPLRLVTRHSLLTYAAKHWQPWQLRFLSRVVACEAQLRRLRAWWRGDAREAKVYQELALLVADFQGKGMDHARRRLERLVRQVDLRLGL